MFRYLDTISSWVIGNVLGRHTLISIHFVGNVYTVSVTTFKSNEYVFTSLDFNDLQSAYMWAMLQKRLFEVILT